MQKFVEMGGFDSRAQKELGGKKKFDSALTEHMSRNVNVIMTAPRGLFYW